MLQSRTPAGARDRKIRIESPVVTDGDANSDLIETWETVCEPMAKLSDYQGHESFQADRLATQKVTVFNIRYRTGLTEKMRIVFDGYAYRIFSMKKVGRNKELDIAAEFLDNEMVT